MSAIIRCVSCGEDLYRCYAIGREFTGAQIEAKDFEPIRADIPQPKDKEEALCPLCGKLYYFVQENLRDNEVETGALLLLSSGAWWPHPPIDQI